MRHTRALAHAQRSGGPAGYACPAGLLELPRSIPACAGCHGARGEGNGTFPRLAGQHADYVVKQLVVFQRTDERPEGAIMKTVAHALTEDNMEAVAAYVQGL